MTSVFRQNAKDTIKALRFGHLRPSLRETHAWLRLVAPHETKPCYASPLRLSWNRLGLRLSGYHRLEKRIPNYMEWGWKATVWMPLDATEEMGEMWVRNRRAA